LLEEVEVGKAMVSNSSVAPAGWAEELEAEGAFVGLIALRSGFIT
jgi:hypothetical protein